MNERQKIEDRLRKKEQELQVLEEKSRNARVYVQALRDIIKLLDNEPEGTPAETALRPGSAVAQAREVILRRSEPVHVNDLMEALGRESTRESRASLTSSLASYVRRGEIFTRPAPNTFGLVELGHTTALDDSPEPPSSFGRSTTAKPITQLVDDDIPF